MNQQEMAARLLAVEDTLQIDKLEKIGQAEVEKIVDKKTLEKLGSAEKTERLTNNRFSSSESRA